MARRSRSRRHRARSRARTARAAPGSRTGRPRPPRAGRARERPRPRDPLALLHRRSGQRRDLPRPQPLRSALQPRPVPRPAALPRAVRAMAGNRAKGERMTAMDHVYAEEHGLVEAYLKDRLSESEREAFEAHYFACEACMEQLETASDFREGMLQVAAEDTARAGAARAQLGLLAGLALLSRGRRLALAALLLLLLAFPFVLLLESRGLQRQLAAARAGHDQRIASLEEQLRSLQGSSAEERRRLEQELAKERQGRAAAGEAAGPQVNLPLFTLAAVRSGEAGREPVNRISLDPKTPSVILTMELATVDFPAYRAALRDESGREIWQAGGLRPDGRDSLVILLPSRMLSPGIYRLALEGVKPGGQGYAVAAYPFRVVRSR